MTVMSFDNNTFKRGQWEYYLTVELKNGAQYRKKNHLHWYAPPLSLKC